MVGGRSWCTGHYFNLLSWWEKRLEFQQRDIFSLQLDNPILGA